MIYDHYHEKWNKPIYIDVPPWMSPIEQTKPKPSPITPEEIEEFRRLLDRARKYDQEHNQPDCELESKRQKLRDLSKELGVEIDFI